MKSKYCDPVSFSVEAAKLRLATHAAFKDLVDGAMAVKESHDPQKHLGHAFLMSLLQSNYLFPPPKSGSRDGFAFGLDFPPLLNAGDKVPSRGVRLWTNLENAEPFVDLLRGIGHKSARVESVHSTGEGAPRTVIAVSDDWPNEYAWHAVYEACIQIVLAFEQHKSDLKIVRAG